MPGTVYGVAPLIRMAARIADMHVAAIGRLFARVSSGLCKHVPSRPPIPPGSNRTATIHVTIMTLMHHRMPLRCRSLLDPRCP
jgi:hypothetical protein